MRTWVIAIAFLLLLLPLLPATSASQATPDLEPGIHDPEGAAETTMYVHLGIPSDYPINTQQPDDRYGVSRSPGMTTMTNTCVDDEAVPGLVRGDRHTWYAYSSPGYVEYDFDQGGKPRVHPERGLSYDVDFDTSKPVRLKWYVESQMVGAEAGANEVPAVMPQVVLRGTLREGDEISVGHEAMNTGRVIAQAQTEPVLLAGPATPDHAQVSYVPVQDANGTKHVYEFSLDLPWAEPGRSPQVPKDESFNLRVDLFIANEACGDAAAGEFLMPNTVRLHSSVGHRPRFTWDVLDAVRIEVLHPQFVGDDLVIHTQANSPWGNYDVRGDKPDEAGGYTVEVLGPSIPINLDLAFFNSLNHDHDHHTEAVSASWVWPYRAERPADGVYTVVLRVLNDQETAESRAVATFTLGGEQQGCVTGADGSEQCGDDPRPEKDTPGVGAALLLPALGALAAARRRR